MTFWLLPFCNGYCVNFSYLRWASFRNEIIVAQYWDRERHVDQEMNVWLIQSTRDNAPLPSLNTRVYCMRHCTVGFFERKRSTTILTSIKRRVVWMYRDKALLQSYQKRVKLMAASMTHVGMLIDLWNIDYLHLKCVFHFSEYNHITELKYPEKKV